MAASKTTLQWLATASEEQRWFWLLGILEMRIVFTAGRPSQPRVPRLEMELEDEHIMRTIALLLGTNLGLTVRGTGSGYNQRLTLGGRRAVAVMQKLQSWLSARRQLQIRRVLTHFTANGGTIDARLAGEICAAPYCLRAPQAAKPWCTVHAAHMAVHHG